MGIKVSVLTIRGSQGLYRAHKAGETTLTATGDPTCRQARPPCGAPSREFRLQVIVRQVLVQKMKRAMPHSRVAGRKSAKQHNHASQVGGAWLGILGLTVTPKPVSMPPTYTTHGVAAAGLEAAR